MSDYGRTKQNSELDSLVSKRDQIRQARIANTKPDDDTPSIKEMSDEEIQAMFAKKNAGGGSSSIDGGDGDAAAGEEEAIIDSGLAIDDLFSNDYIPEFKTKRSGGGSRGLSGGESGGVLGELTAEGEEGEEGGPKALFVDWTEDYEDENEFHIPNRLGFSTEDWGNGKAGFVSGKLKKKDRKMGKFNKTDLKVRFIIVRYCYYVE